MFKKILAAIDGSEISHDVFKTALDIAKADKANLLLLIVMGHRGISALNELLLGSVSNYALLSRRLRYLSIYNRRDEDLWHGCESRNLLTG